MDTTEIIEVLELYFDGCYEGDGDKITKVFHDSAHVYGHAPDGSLSDTPKADFVKLVSSMPDGTPSYPREDKIISIDFTGENTAIAQVQIRVFNTLFTDMLCFMRVDGKWGVIAKVYSGVSIEV